MSCKKGEKISKEKRKRIDIKKEISNIPLELATNQRKFSFPLITKFFKIK